MSKNIDPVLIIKNDPYKLENKNIPHILIYKYSLRIN
jgi:hypothetical protein